jgi:hypothetical protein
VSRSRLFDTCLLLKIPHSVANAIVQRCVRNAEVGYPCRLQPLFISVTSKHRFQNCGVLLGGELFMWGAYLFWIKYGRKIKCIFWKALCFVEIFYLSLLVSALALYHMQHILSPAKVRFPSPDSLRNPPYRCIVYFASQTSWIVVQRRSSDEKSFRAWAHVCGFRSSWATMTVFHSV